MKNKIRLIIGIILFILFLTGITAYIYIPNKARSETTNSIPTVFIHGYKGTAKSFNTMLNRFEKNGWGKKGLVYFISSNGRILDYKVNGAQADQMFVQIILQNNRANFSDSARWLSDALRYLKENYNVNTVNLVGHSMGGIISVYYMQQYNTEDYPNVRRFVAIGSPFDGIYNKEYFKKHQDAAANDLKPNSVALRMLYQGGFPQTVDVLNIGSTGDLVAYPESVQTIRNIVPENQLKEVIIQDDDLGHSDLHESQKVDQMIHSFLWQDESQ